MYTLGHDFMPSGEHAGGLRYHGASPILSQLYHDKCLEASPTGKRKSRRRRGICESGGDRSRAESAHAVKGALEEAKKYDAQGEKKTILFNLSGHGYFDMYAYESYFAGKMTTSAFDEEKMKESLKKLPVIKE
jgi:tryptophan synthase beta chain